MASLQFTVGGAAVNALAFSGTNFIFSRLTDHGAAQWASLVRKTSIGRLY